MAKPKRPAKLKFPKKPKNKTIDNMKRYLDKVDEVKRENARREKQYKSDVKKWEALKKRVESSKR